MLCTSFAPDLPCEVEERNQRVHELLLWNLTGLQYQVMVWSFGLTSGEVSLTLSQLAKRLGVSVTTLKRAKRTAIETMAKVPELQELLRDSIPRQRVRGALHAPHYEY